MTHGLWKVVGHRRYRGHEPGETFEASLQNAPAVRAIQRGDIILLEEFHPDLPAEWSLPEGWTE